MTILPCSCWPLAEHALFGQNGFDASLGSVFVCINDSMPMDACFFKPPCSFHRLVESYPVIFVEFALVEIGGTSFQSYVDYARLLGITLSDIFNSVLSGAADKTLKGQRSMWGESELIEKIKIAAEILRSRGEFVTKTAISRIAEISSYQLFKYPSTKAYFEQLVRENKSIEGKALLRPRKVFEDVKR